tara:strand:+ start:2009 stop:2833 length:825 start_codon:yes stop_codon:yes gene_type:complete
MNWINEKLQKAIELLYKLNSRWFILVFPAATLVITSLGLSAFYYLFDICFKADICPKEHEGEILLNFFLLLWIACMVICASLLFGLGSRTLKYINITDRVDDLKTSGLVNRTKSNISLIGLSLFPFTSENWQNIFEEKLKSGVHIRLLVVDPNTEFATGRHSSLRGQNKKLCNDIETAVGHFTDFKAYMSSTHGDVSKNFEIGLYKNNASMSTFICDDEIRLGLIIEKGTGLTAPEIRINKHGKQAPLFEIITDHFNEVWKDATKIKLPENNHG